MSKKILWMTTIFLIVFILSARYSQAMYFPSEQGWQERIEEGINYALNHPEFYIRKDQDVEITTDKRILEEINKRIDNWWQIARSEWGTMGVPTVVYFALLDDNMLSEWLGSSAIILTPFLFVVCGTCAEEVAKESAEKWEQAEYFFESTKRRESEKARRMFELTAHYTWIFHIPFIVHSKLPFPPETKYFLRYYPEDYVMGVDEEIKAKAVYVSSRESVVPEAESAGFFYYLAFSYEEILGLREGSPSFNEDISELLGRMVLTVVTNMGEELIFPFDLSEMR